MVDRKTYFARRQSLYDEIKVVRSDSLLDLLAEAILNSDLCLVTYCKMIQSTYELGDYFVFKKDDIQNIQRLRIGKQAENQQYLEELREINPELADEYQDKLEIWDQFFDSVDVLSASFYQELIAMFVNAISQLEKILFEVIYLEDDARFAKEAAVKVLKVLVGLIPGIGNVTDSAISIKEILNARRIVHETADNHLAILESYSMITKEWSLVAQIIIDLIKSVTTKKSISVTGAITTCNDRRNEIFEKLKRG